MITFWLFSFFFAWTQSCIPVELYQSGTEFYTNSTLNVAEQSTCVVSATGTNVTVLSKCTGTGTGVGTTNCCKCASSCMKFSQGSLLSHPNFDIGPLSRPLLTIGAVLFLDTPCQGGVCTRTHQIIFGEPPGRTLGVYIEPKATPPYTVTFCRPQTDGSCTEFGPRYRNVAESIQFTIKITYWTTFFSLSLIWAGNNKFDLSSMLFESAMESQPLVWSNAEYPLKGQVESMFATNRGYISLPQLQNEPDPFCPINNTVPCAACQSEALRFYAADEGGLANPECRRLPIDSQRTPVATTCVAETGDCCGSSQSDNCLTKYNSYFLEEQHNLFEPNITSSMGGNVEWNKQYCESSVPCPDQPIFTVVPVGRPDLSFGLFGRHVPKTTVLFLFWRSSSEQFDLERINGPFSFHLHVDAPDHDAQNTVALANLTLAIGSDLYTYNVDLSLPTDVASQTRFVFGRTVDEAGQYGDYLDGSVSQLFLVNRTMALAQWQAIGTRHFCPFGAELPACAPLPPVAVQVPKTTVVNPPTTSLDAAATTAPPLATTSAPSPISNNVETPTEPSASASPPSTSETAISPSTTELSGGSSIATSLLLNWCIWIAFYGCWLQ